MKSKPLGLSSCCPLRRSTYNANATEKKKKKGQNKAGKKNTGISCGSSLFFKVAVHGEKVEQVDGMMMVMGQKGHHSSSARCFPLFHLRHIYYRRCYPSFNNMTISKVE
jgi:hypothetical protein